MTDVTARWVLPLLHAGQAQKEMTHNEALARLDALLHPRVVAAGLNIPPADPEPGEGWIVGTAPTGAWAGEANALAAWSDGGWIFVTPSDGIQIWVTDTAEFAQFLDGAWAPGRLNGKVFVGGKQVLGPRRSAIPDPLGGSIVDPEARAAIIAVLAAMRAHGLIETL
jgi:hypothetical protein